MAKTKTKTKAKRKSLVKTNAIVEQKNPLFREKLPKTKTIKTTTHYQVIFSKQKKIPYLNQATKIVTENHLDADDNFIRSKSESFLLPEPEAELLAKKLGVSYKPSKLFYHYRVDEKLKYVNGYTTRNHEHVKPLSAKQFKAMRR